MSRIGGRLRGGTPLWGPKLPCLPAGGQVEAKNGLKIGQNRPNTGLFPGYSQNAPQIRQKALVLPLGHICAGTKAPCALPLAIFGDKNRLYTAWCTPVYSANRMQGKQGKRPRRVAPQGWPPAGLAPQGSSCFHCHRPRSARINLVNYQL